MKKILMPVMVLLLAPSMWNQCFSQALRNIPKNYPGLFVGVEWNTLSGLVGAEYERWLWKKERFTLGVKAAHVFTYKNGNMELLSSSFDGSSSFSLLMPTVHYFTSQHSNTNRGFFLHSGLGIGERIHNTYSRQFKSTFTPFELGGGFQFGLGSGITLKWTNTLLFAGKGGITLSKLSLGF